MLAGIDEVAGQVADHVGAARRVREGDRPSVPRRATTALATVAPAAKFRLEVAGKDADPGYTVSQPAAVGRTATTLSITAAASAGTPL